MPASRVPGSNAERSTMSSIATSAALPIPGPFIRFLAALLTRAAVQSEARRGLRRLADAAAVMGA